MIHFSFSSVLMTVLMSNILLIIIGLFFYNKRLMATIGYKIVAVFCAVTLVRFMFPFELPFTKTIALPESISTIILRIRHPFYIIGEFKFSIWTIFCVVWIVGAIISLVLFIRDEKNAQNYSPEDIEDITLAEPYASIVREFCSGKQREKLRVIKVSTAPSPLLFGLRHPTILLPTSVADSEILTRAAMQHELFHYTHHDLWLKFLVKCLVCVYWWNPFSHVLNYQVSELLEMRIDKNMLSADSDTAAAYVTTLKTLLTDDNSSEKYSPLASGFLPIREGSRGRRINMMLNAGKQPNYALNIALLILILGIYILSYLFILEAHYYPPEMTDPYIVPNSGNFHAILNENGYYDIYYEDILIDTTDSLDYYPEDMEIYTSEEEFHDKEY